MSASAGREVEKARVAKRKADMMRGVKGAGGEGGWWWLIDVW